jgi:hypothetical protein
MQLLSCHNGQLHAVNVAAWGGASKQKTFTTGLSALDELLPGGAFARGAVHELLVLPSHPPPLFAALLLARCAIQENHRFHRLHRLKNPNSESVKSVESVVHSLSWGAIVWCDPLHALYPPAVAAMGVPLDRLFLLHPKTVADENWAVTECLRCRGVAATVASPRRLSRIEARRFQLAAERGGGVGLLLRPFDRTAQIYAAATRWLVGPCRGERTVQRWKMQLIHGHGGRVGQGVILENHRDTGTLQARVQVHPVREADQLADRPAAQTARKTA